MKERLDKLINSSVGNALDRFFNTPFYSIAVCASCMLAHLLDEPLIGIVLFMLMLVASFVFCKNSFVIVPILVMCCFMLSNDALPSTGYFGTPFKLIVTFISFALIAAALLFNIIYYGKWRTMFKRAYFSVSLALLTGVLLVGGFTAKEYSWGCVGIAALICVTSFLPYSYIVNGGEYKGRKTVEYFAYAVIAAFVAIAAGFLKRYIINDFNVDMGSVKSFLALGFVGPNTGAAIITLAIPLTFYLAYVYKHGYLFLLLVTLELFVITFTFSRASIVVAYPATLILAVALCFKKKRGRLGYYITFGAIVAAIVTLIIVFRKPIHEKVLEMFAGNITGSGRTTMWKEGFFAWLERPIFGVSIWYLRFGDRCWYYSFHCTPLTYLYCCGIVGLAAYAYHRYKTVRAVFSAKLTAERVFVALTMLAMVCNALLDIALTSPLHLLYYSIMLAVIERDVSKVKAERSASETSIATGSQNVSETGIKKSHKKFPKKSIGV